MNVNDGGPAFPNPPGAFNPHTGPGMSLRDYFAAHAPEMPDGWTGIVPLSERLSRADDMLYRLIEWRWFYADAMLAARLNTPTAPTTTPPTQS